MLINSLIWNIWNPGRYLPRNNHVYLARDGTTEVEATKVRTTGGNTLLAMLTFGLFFRKKRESQPFMETNSGGGRSDVHPEE